jgi:hypothetical protein
MSIAKAEGINKRIESIKIGVVDPSPHEHNEVPTITITTQRKSPQEIAAASAMRESCAAVADRAANFLKEKNRGGLASVAENIATEICALEV